LVGYKDNNPNIVENYKEIAKLARIKVLEMIYKAQVSHIGSNFSCIDILAVLFNKITDKDKVIFSKGWVAAAAYYFLSLKGIIPKEDLKLYCEEGSPYIGLVEPSVEGIHFAGGSMGYGLPAGVGFALAKKLSKEAGRIYVLMSDGELAIGTTWEALLIAIKHNLKLTVIVDWNGYQAMGKVEDILPIPIPDIFKAKTINGHDYREISSALKNSDFILAKTVKGKGVSFMENNNLYHYKAPSKREYELALKELNG